MSIKRVLFAAVAAGAVAAAGQAAERAKATVECAPTEARYVYDCTIMLMGRKSGAPVEGATVVVGADMPSMAMAHNVRPVTAVPMDKPGMYHARIELEMHGDWALKLDVSGPLRDRIIHTMRFGPGAGDHAGGEAKRGAMKHGHDKMEHADEKKE